MDLLRTWKNAQINNRHHRVFILDCTLGNFTPSSDVYFTFQSTKTELENFYIQKPSILIVSNFCLKLEHFQIHSECLVTTCEVARTTSSRQSRRQKRRKVGRRSQPRQPFRRPSLRRRWRGPSTRFVEGKWRKRSTLELLPMRQSTTSLKVTFALKVVA